MLKSRFKMAVTKEEILPLLVKGVAFGLDLAVANFIYFALNVLDMPLIKSETYRTVDHLISLYVLVFITRLYFVILTGVSLGQLLLGVRSVKGGFIWKRLGGSLRTVFEFVLTPLLFVDSFQSKNGDEYKEKFSATKLIVDTNFTKFILTAVVLITSSILFSMAPLLSDFKNADGWVVSFQESKIEKLDKGEDFSNYKIHMSNRFHFKTLSSLSNERFRIVPGFEIKKQNAKSIMTPMFSVYDTNLKIKSDVRMIKRLSLEGLVKHFTKGNPFVGVSFPHLSNPSLKSKDSSDFKKELLNWTKTSFSLNAQNILKYPMLAPSLVEYRKYLLSQLRPGAVPEVDLVEMGNATFLRFRQNFKKQLELPDQFIETYLPLIADEVVMWEMVWNRGLDDALARKEFLSSFFASAEWFYGDKDLYDLPTNELDMRELMLVDFFIKKDLNEQQKNSIEGFTFQLFFDLSRIALVNNDKLLLDLVSDRIKQFNLVIKMRSSGEEKFFNSSFAQRMRELYNSLKASDKSYFGF